MPLSERDKDEIRRRFEKLSKKERKEFLDEMERQIEAKRQIRNKPFPKLIRVVMHKDEEDFRPWDYNEALGLHPDDRWNPCYQVECIVEVPKNASEAQIIAVNGYMIDFSKPFERRDEIVKPED